MQDVEFLWDTVIDDDKLGFARQRATKAGVDCVLNSPVHLLDGRSEWFFIRLPNGDLVLATYPRGDTYFETELHRSV